MLTKTFVINTIVILILTIIQEAKSKEVRNILSFGGNGMIGSETIKQLLEVNKIDKNIEYKITLISRGSWPYDSSKTIKPHVSQWIYCDRSAGSIELSCPKLIKEIQSQEYYAVMDFSCFFREWIEDIISVFEKYNASPRVYVYISTDNVYEVSQPLSRYFNDDFGNTKLRFLKESDAVRPDDDELRMELMEFDVYGSNKLSVEEYLREQRQENGIPFVCIRLADVIGQRDSSPAFYFYYLWVKFSYLTNIVPPLSVPDDILETNSVTYVKDAAASVILSITTPLAWNESYNIACEEVFNTTHFIEHLGMLLGIKNVTVKRIDLDNEEEEDVFRMYPGVTRGPLSVQKAIDLLKFQPTLLNQMIKETLYWHELAFVGDATLREQFLNDWIDYMFQNDDLYSDEFTEELFDNIMREYEIKHDFTEF